MFKFEFFSDDRTTIYKSIDDKITYDRKKKKGILIGKDDNSKKYSKLVSNKLPKRNRSHCIWFSHLVMEIFGHASWAFICFCSAPYFPALYKLVENTLK